jgi:hypothetical protein
LHPLVVDYITIVEKEKLIKRCENDLIFREIIAYLHEFMTPIIVFGSSVLNTIKANDFDILTLKNINLVKLEKRLNIKFHISTISKINQINLTMKNEITKNHIIVNSAEVWIKWMLED